MPDRFTVYAWRMFDGSGGPPAENVWVTAEGGRITGIESGMSAAGSDFETDFLCPGFIDIQINGALDILFNDAPSAETIDRMAEGARRGGAAHILPTFITAPGRDYEKAMAAVKAARKNGAPGVLGVHLEGPFLSPEKPGIHPAEHIRTPDEDDFKALTADGCGVRLITVAPERIGADAVKRLRESGAVVFAGHTAADAEDMAAAEAAGLCGVTHLFNAMTPMTARAPGAGGAALGSDGLFAGIIADGHHVHPRNLELARRAMLERLCLVTDAMPTLEGEADTFDLYGKTIHLQGGRLTDDAGTLAGANLAMDESVKNMTEMTNASFGEAVAMASANPARALGLGNELGFIKPGFRASMTLLSEDMEGDMIIGGTVVDGRVFDALGRPCPIP